DPQRRGLPIAGDAHDARQTLYDLIVGGVELERAVLAKSGNRAIDQVAPHLFERGIAEPKPLHDARAEGLDHHTGPSAEPAEDRPAVRSLQVESKGSLARVLTKKRCAQVGAIETGIRTELARQIARAGHLDLDPLGAKLRKLIATERTSQHIGQVEDAHTRK